MPLFPPLAQKVIFITGASTGIGAALAIALAERYSGIRLVLTARSQENLEVVAAACRHSDAGVLTVPADLANVDQNHILVEKALTHFGRVDALINNAGYGQMGPIELIPMTACQRQFSVNLFAPLALTQALIPAMRDQGSGRIVNISSIGGRMAFPFGGLYSASKFALEALSDALRMELEPFNIQVSVIEPGPVSTNFFAVVTTVVEQAMPHPEATPYRAAFKKLQGLEQQTSANAWTSEQVANVIIQALTAPHPRPRYVAATGGDALLAMAKLLPTRLLDKFWQQFYGIDQVATEWHQTSKGQKQP